MALRQGRGVAARLLGAWFPATLIAAAGVCAPGASAATLSLPDGAGAPAGASTLVHLTVDDATGMAGTFIEIAYDPAVALATAVSTTPLSAGQALTFNLSPPGTIRIALYGDTPLSGSGALLAIQFSSVGPVGSRTALDLVQADINEGAIPAILDDGGYCVAGLVFEVNGLRLSPSGAAGGTTALLEWNPDAQAAAYNVYRGSRPDLADLGCLLPGVTTTGAVDDGAAPPAGEVLVYLVSAVNCRGESILGAASNNVPRPNRFPCP